MDQTPYNRVRAARENGRPTGLDYIQNIFHGFIELHGDRRFGDDPAVVGGIARLGGEPVTVIAIEKGHTAKERAHRSCGAPQPEGYRKALRLMKQAEKFGRPVICLVDTAGAYCGVGAEERGQGQAIAENLAEMSVLCVPLLAILVGEGGSGGALALAAADRVWMLENAVYSVISPEGCASILWKDAGRAAEAAAGLRLTAQDARAMGIVERILPEQDMGKKAFYDRIRTLLQQEIRMLSNDPELLQKRYERYRKIGACETAGQQKGAPADALI
ncbi:MAG: acetyl-CoA carboxylase carboxyl transferase subunit alpha [Butyricicoccaceae bacterium]